MARPRQFKIGALAELFRQIQYAPPEARWRQMNAAEQLVRDIDPHRNYPEEFVVYRITGYRPDTEPVESMIVGDALRSELVTFVQRLSGTLSLRREEIDREPIELDQVAAELQVTTRTIQRYRRQGLVCHEIVDEAGGTRLVCFADALAHFRSKHADRLAEAASFTRVKDDVERAVIAEARELRRAKNMTLHKCAEVLAERHGRARETMRGILQRHERSAADPIFTERGPLTEHEQRVIARAFRFGVEPTLIAEGFGRSRKTVYRVLLQQQSRFLRSLPVDAIKLSTFDLEAADQVLLSPPIVCSDLRQPASCVDAKRFIELVKAAAALREADEQALLGAYNFLKHRARHGISRLRNELSADVIDAIETDLRWAALVKRRIMFMTMSAAITTVERNLTRPLLQQSAEEICRFVPLAGEVVSEAIESINAGRDQRLSRVVSFAMDKRLARLRFSVAERRAAARHAADTLMIEDPLARCTPWQQRLDLAESLAVRVHRLHDSDEALVIQRFGLDGTPPRTCSDLAAELGSTSTGVRRRLRRSLLKLRRIAARSWST